MRHRTPCHVALVLVLTVGLAPIGASGGPPATFGDLKVGQVVSVDGRPAGAGAVLARIIEIEAGPDADRLKGQIEAISAKDNSFTVLGVKVVASPDAHIADRNGGAQRLSSLQKGWVVKARGQMRKDGILHATDIKVGYPASEEAEVQGRIQALDAARRTLTVIGLTIRVTGTTRIAFD